MCILLQETHLTKDEQFNIFRHQHHSWNTSPQTWYCHICTIGCTEWSRSTTMDGVTTINVYMPPNIPFTHLPQYPHPAIYAGDFNCQNTLLRYRNNTTDGTMLNDWASNIELTLLYYNRQPNSVCSGRWQTQTNPDLAFTTSNSEHTNCVLRIVTDLFPRSQQRPSIITQYALIKPTTIAPILRWNLQKAHWDNFTNSRPANM